jgi:hypothetical protein
MSFNPNDLELIRRHSGSDVNKRHPPTTGDWILTSMIVGIFAVVILVALVKHHFF